MSNDADARRRVGIVALGVSARAKSPRWSLKGFSRAADM